MAPRASFMSLPPELRNHVYDLAGLFQQARIQVSKVKEPTIALANRQIRSEVLGIFYGQNVFAGQNRAEIKGFLSRQPPSTLASLRAVQLNCGGPMLLCRVRTFLTRDMKPFLDIGLGAEVVTAQIRVKGEGVVFVTASGTADFKQHGRGISKDEITRVKRGGACGKR
ncbi:hypothetical protein CLAFUW4_11971 [Fulvia fulva]|uniref:Uncharacterized protein n=1 Tax=Passalora fulva TaxID=5499 RepID=A0A9Q8PF43_PASFU|nr:uncharacterized protein CLAFUR5_11013 [Fulvia fulva]KAK4618019.1 hypothetical protein CLAFUR4_11976 [Fulvia fulva]KAK4619066.1 hypothetical protein CLAFUR0_11987 [Fulvia fulva]UJO21313.1 hypothetical protein CLAFUR5_11013 [Fulvia fulva]WPV18058.1 hypothetical protein CLAFUW4_11971 [Fulvia fulva]WPV33211.1 hypothetical protein CLAFUW7_11978 [Fulvia fulva]